MEHCQTSDTNTRISLKYAIPIIIGGGMFIGFASLLLRAAVSVGYTITDFLSTANLALLGIIWILLITLTYFLGEYLDAVRHKVLKIVIVGLVIVLSLGAGIAMHVGRWGDAPSYTKEQPVGPIPYVVYKPVSYPVYTPPVEPEYPSTRLDRCRMACRVLVGPYNYWAEEGSYNNFSRCVQNCCESDNE